MSAGRRKKKTTKIEHYIENSNKKTVRRLGAGQEHTLETGRHFPPSGTLQERVESVSYSPPTRAHKPPTGHRTTGKQCRKNQERM